MKAKQIVNKLLESAPDSVVLACFQILNQHSEHRLSGGNCGQVAYAIVRYLHDTIGRSLSLGLITNATDEADLQKGEPDVYHVYVVDENGRKFDEVGEIDDDYLVQLASDQYGNSGPFEYIFEPDELDKVLTVISQQTAWDDAWNYFYTVLAENIGDRHS